MMNFYQWLEMERPPGNIKVYRCINTQWTDHKLPIKGLLYFYDPSLDKRIHGEIWHKLTEYKPLENNFIQKLRSVNIVEEFFTLENFEEIPDFSYAGIQHGEMIMSKKDRLNLR